MKGERTSKFRNRIAVYRGQTYDSNFEADYAAELDLKRRGGLIKSWERQVNIPLMAWGKTICDYKVDFKVHHNDGSVEYIECKGKWTPEARIKWKMFEAQIEATEPGTVLTVELLRPGFRTPKKRLPTYRRLAG